MQILFRIPRNKQTTSQKHSQKTTRLKIIQNLSRKPNTTKKKILPISPQIILKIIIKNLSTKRIKTCLKKSNEMAAGPDGIYYQFLTHLPQDCLLTLLKLLNTIWLSGEIPSSWKEAIVVPIPKLNRDFSDPTNYRPVALTSCLCKVMERMVNDRLVWVLESKILISKFQCGFRKDHSILDHLVRLEHFICEAFAEKKQVLAVFFLPLESL